MRTTAVTGTLFIKGIGVTDDDSVFILDNMALLRP